MDVPLNGNRKEGPRCPGSAAWSQATGFIVLTSYFIVIRAVDLRIHLFEKRWIAGSKPGNDTSDVSTRI